MRDKEVSSIPVRWCPAARRLAADEAGGGTIWGLMSIILLAGIAGLAVDVTDAFRGRTMLQATADAAALAAAIDLDDESAARDAAQIYAARNMAPAEHGRVLETENIAFGSWDAASRTFSPGTSPADTVHVTVRRAAVGDNAWPTNFLRIIGLFSWDITVQAAAQRFIPDCLTDGLLARGRVDISSNNDFTGGMCIHGNAGVDLQNHNSFGPDVRVAVPRLPEDLSLPADGMESNPGLGAALVEDILDPRMVNHIEEVMDGLIALDPAIIPEFVAEEEPVLERDERYDFADAQPGRVYHIICSPNKTVGIPAGALLERVVIVADCRLHVGANAVLTDVVLASRAGETGPGSASISFASNVTLGLADACAEGGGVQVFTNGSIHFSSSMTMDGVQIVAAGDIELGARDEGIRGINAQAGGDITLTSNDAFGQCTGGAPALFTSWYYRLVF